MSGEKAAYSYGAVNPEDFHNFAVLISPSSTPVMSAMGDGYEVKDTSHNWSTDALRAAATNAVVEGATVTPVDPSATVKLTNYTQLSDGSYYLTTTQDAIARKNNRPGSIGNQMAKCIKEVKLDMEKAIITNATQVKSAASTAGVAGGLPYWLNTSNYNYANVIAGGTAKFDEDTHFIPAMAAIFADHDPESLTMIVSPTNKNKVDKFTGGSVRNIDGKSGTLYNNIKNIQTAYGDVAVMISRYMPDTSVFILDMDYWKKGFLDEFNEFEITSRQRRDKHRIQRGVACEWTIECRAIAANAHINALIA
jgi:hypothetical protein